MVNFQIINYDETITETDYFETTQAKNNQSYLSLFMNYNRIYCRLLCADDEMIKKFKESKVIKVIPELIGQQEYFYIAGLRKQLENIKLCAAVLVSFQNIDNYELFYYPNKKDHRRSFLTSSPLKSTLKAKICFISVGVSFQFS